MPCRLTVFGHHLPSSGTVDGKIGLSNCALPSCLGCSARQPVSYQPVPQTMDTSYEYDNIDLEGPAFRPVRLYQGHRGELSCDLFQAVLHQREE
ncbi:hypothetical protein ACQKWADRAFT_305116 [Trichoderma austrokoningii]